MSPDALLPATLPCIRCPYDARCCSYGTDLTPAEAQSLAERYGADRVVWNGSDWRTRVSAAGRCVFQDRDGGCSLHDDPAYPAVCRGFPWREADSERPYAGDLTICPELTRVIPAEALTAAGQWAHLAGAPAPAPAVD